MERIQREQQQQQTDVVDEIVASTMGGVRYEYLPMPNVMKATTIYVRNLCECVTEEEMSELFARVSTLSYVPACVIRKMDTTSLGYGFVSFPTIAEKEVR